MRLGGTKFKLDQSAQDDVANSHYVLGEFGQDGNGKKSQHQIGYNDAYSDVLYGQFGSLANDFSPSSDSSADKRFGFVNQSHWTIEKRQRVKKFRYVVCSLALSSITICLMSRMLLNMAIVDMVLHPIMVDQQSDDMVTTESEIVFNDTTMTPATMIMDILPNEMEDFEAGLRFNWTEKEKNALLGSFYIGYMPAIMFSGGLVIQMGAKRPLILAVAGTAIINLLTPTIAKYSYLALLLSRVLLGIIQGAIVPALYETFNKWLTASEAGMFAALMKVSSPMGSLLGSALPGVISSMKLKWPALFYIASVSCILWTIAWAILASSTPHTNRFVDSSELDKITRKKSNPTGLSIIGADHSTNDEKNSIKPAPSKPRKTPWLLIITNPSVLALTFVKYTYNLAMDFFYIELGIYLDNMHDASPEIRSLIAVAGYLMQMVFITFVGLAAKSLIARKALGLSVTKWRKIFQGSSNLAMAAIYFIFPFFSSELKPVAFLIMAIWFFWMLGAGGETFVPYDLSRRYPAAIVAFAHSISIFSGVSVPLLCTVVLGNDSKSSSGWNTLFIIVGCLSAIGGLVFVLVVKAKPFLPEELKQPTQQNEMTESSK